MAEKWMVTSNGQIWQRNSEAEAVSCAKDLLADRRAEAGDFGWSREVEMFPVRVTKVMYESRACDFREPTWSQLQVGFTHACDYQMFDLSEEELPAPVDSVPGYVRADDLLTQLVTDFTHLVTFERENAVVRALLEAMPRGCVSVFHCEGVKFLNETYGDGTKMVYYKNDGCYAFGAIDLIVNEAGEREPWWD